jgi:hypothetical protein
VPWTASYLRLRHDCYAASNDPRLSLAAGDLNKYRSALSQAILGENDGVDPVN